jgi:hypothetical protein
MSRCFSSKQFLFAVVLSISSLVFGQSVTFTQGPTASLASPFGINITFAVSASTDVEVAILNASGSIVRHLAAGVLGGTHEPPAPLVPGLSQNLTWNGLDDYGNAPQGGPFRARVRLGLTPVYERSISTQVMSGSGWSYGPGNKEYKDDWLDSEHDILKKIYGCYPNTASCAHATTLTYLDLAVSDATEEIFAKIYRSSSTDEARFNGLTGQFNGVTTINFTAERAGFGEQALGWNGQYLYHTTGLDVVGRFTINGAPAAWPGTGLNTVAGLQQGFQHSRGIAAGPDGSVYVLHHLAHRAFKDGRVTKIGPQGNIEKPQFIRIDAVVAGIAVDPQGNIFVGARVKPKLQPWPPELNGPLLGLPKALKTESFYPWAPRLNSWWAEEVYGSILKFGPSGGSVTIGDGEYRVRRRELATASGLTGAYFGYSFLPTHDQPATGIGCCCNASRFDVDRFGRVFLPDGYRLSMVVLDNNMNEILRIHNKDITQTKTGHFQLLQVTDRALYAGDSWNNHIVSFTLGAEKESVTDLPVGLDYAELPLSGSLSLVNSPNPFKFRTVIRLLGGQDPAGGNPDVTVDIFNVDGKRVFTLTSEYGLLADGLPWNTAGLAPGVYLAKLRLGNKILERKMVVVN